MNKFWIITIIGLCLITVIYWAVIEIVVSNSVLDQRLGLNFPPSFQKMQIFIDANNQNYSFSTVYAKFSCSKEDLVSFLRDESFQRVGDSDFWHFPINDVEPNWWPRAQIFEVRFSKLFSNGGYIMIGWGDGDAYLYKDGADP